jgi:hypothetical protein
VDADLQALFLSEAEMQCRFILYSAQDFDAARKAADLDRTWLAVQGMLSSAANLSKLFWGSGSDPEQSAEIEARRAPLREGVGLSDSSPLKPRSVRNKFEHWDNYLLEWHRQAHRSFSTRGIISGGVGSRLIQWPGGVEPKHFGLLDPDTGAVTFWNNSTSLPALAQEAQALLPRIEQRQHVLFSERARQSGGGQEQSSPDG